jgi:hypothetical protein
LVEFFVALPATGGSAVGARAFAAAAKQEGGGKKKQQVDVLSFWHAVGMIGSTADLIEAESCLV